MPRLAGLSMPPIAQHVTAWLAKTYTSSVTAPAGMGLGGVVTLPFTASGAFGRKESPVGGLIVSSYGLAQPVRTPRRFDKLADEGYNQCPPVYRGVNLIASALAGLPWKLYQRGKDGNKRGVILDSHPLLDLMQRPNPTQGWGKFVEAYVGYLYIAGNSYIWANQPKKGGAPTELWTMRPDRMRVVPDEKLFVGGYTYEVNGKQIDFPLASMLHTKMFAPLDDWYGMSPLVVAARSIDIRNAGGDWNLALLQNSGRVPGFFVSKERMGDQQFERMREQLTDRYTGRRNAGLPGLLEDGVSWVANGMNPLDMDWGTLSHEESRDIALAIGVPSEMLGDADVKTFANYGDARASFYTETVLPTADMVRDEWNRWLTPMYGAGLWLDYDTEEVEALAPIRAARWAQVQAATFLTVNEKREATGYDAIANGDVIIVLNTNATLDEVVESAVAKPVEPVGAPLTPGTPAIPAPTGGRPNEGSDTDEGAPTPAPDDVSGGASGGSAAPGGSGVPDGGMGGAVDSGSKAANAANAAPYDPLDDLLAGKVIQLIRPKGARPLRTTPERQRPNRPPSQPHPSAPRYRRLDRTGSD